MLLFQLQNMEKEWKGRTFNLKTKPSNGLEETDGKRNKREQSMEVHSFYLRDDEVNEEMKRYQLEMEKNRTSKRKRLKLSNVFL